MIYSTQPAVNENAELTQAMLNYLGERYPNNLSDVLQNEGIDISAAKQLRLIHQEFVELIAFVCKEKVKERYPELTH